MLNHQLADLPAHLSERIRVHAEGTNENANFVLYWMRTAVRADENPALEVAIRIADQQSLPILVYQAISQDYDYASDRHHMFMLEGARDVQTQLLQRGISYVFPLATRDDCGSHLATLAEQATLVVTEEMPVDPPRRFLHALVSQVATPVICVDTACVVPMRLLKRHCRVVESMVRSASTMEPSTLQPAILDSGVTSIPGYSKASSHAGRILNRIRLTRSCNLHTAECLRNQIRTSDSSDRRR